ncbi:riboflavin biosynthesis protein RibD [Polynucleobacter sp. SHI8]|uniref:bifunctional diaminohydroxyphosphoribosylaminopyrimidine deaminase/5-amino-6-(5-phosphoribosylamino)uracil reductase RibD n=1 Tax=unclassified Polynucleobacter TaxID=2640945 RepID=UPI00249347CA|nr:MULTISPECIES: bifunctional diaminohydroxyphosphoribosylaminopyrimidine deaminase/5-amino-6-(5-phosphoribosylamino)uracil reductase RibD [unclassified Polynucleobacter]BDW10243.1 riboflavin biosynthesis protein RibD [Polynucleobacter sp. SHI2]BDW12689.1 riboflavin biosynthesis protein RibD [Polynucleobacter sp. SHI8]
MSTFDTQDQSFMLQALQLAIEARGVSDPNPRVGCIIVKNNQIIGQGFTQVVGSHHAEIMALQDARQQGHNLQGATVYVTLEPCCHHGKTPPCTNALIEAKIAKIFIATLDPNPLVSGQGVAQLQAQGIEVHFGLFELQAMMQNLGFMKRMKEGSPWVRLKMASSIDGVTALPNGQSQWITSEQARADGHLWRSQANVLLTGIGTVLADNPQLNVRGVPIMKQPLRAIIDSKLDVPLDAHMLHNGATIIYCASSESSPSREKKSALIDMNIQVIEIPNQNGKVDLPAVLKHLAANYEANEVHVEAGFKLNGSLIRENCVDELLLYLAPQLLGFGSGLANIGPLESLPNKNAWEFIDQQILGSDLRVRLMKSQ